MVNVRGSSEGALLFMSEWLSPCGTEASMASDTDALENVLKILEDTIGEDFDTNTQDTDRVLSAMKMLKTFTASRAYQVLSQNLILSVFSWFLESQKQEWDSIELSDVTIVTWRNVCASGLDADVESKCIEVIQAWVEVPATGALSTRIREELSMLSRTSPRIFQATLEAIFKKDLWETAIKKSDLGLERPIRALILADLLSPCGTTCDDKLLPFLDHAQYPWLLPALARLGTAAPDGLFRVAAGRLSHSGALQVIAYSIDMAIESESLWQPAVGILAERVLAEANDDLGGLGNSMLEPHMSRLLSSKENFPILISLVEAVSPHLENESQATNNAHRHKMICALSTLDVSDANSTGLLLRGILSLSRSHQGPYPNPNPNPNPNPISF